MKTLNSKSIAHAINLLDLVDTVLAEWVTADIEQDGNEAFYGAVEALRTHRVNVAAPRQGKRTTDLTSFGTLLYSKMDDIAPGSRVYRISVPERGGDVEVVLENREWDNYKALTYRADGTWSGLSYWCEGQI